MNTGKSAKGNLVIRIIIHLAAVMAICALMVVGVKYLLDWYTMHGKEVLVPNVKHKQFDDAEHLLISQGLDVLVTDTGYVRNLPADCILEQTPEAGVKVKAGRVVSVIINSAHSPMLTLPDIIDNCSYREAKVKLMSMGFKLGAPQYVPGEKDWVYGVRSKGRTLYNGQKVYVDDVLIIQVGEGMLGMEDSLNYADFAPELAVDTLQMMKNEHMEGIFEDVPVTQGGVDEFEVVTEP